MLHEDVGNISNKKREDLLQNIREIRSYISAAPQDENSGNLLAYLSDLEKICAGCDVDDILEFMPDKTEEM